MYLTRPQQEYLLELLKGLNSDNEIMKSIINAIPDYSLIESLAKQSIKMLKAEYKVDYNFTIEDEACFITYTDFSIDRNREFDDLCGKVLSEIWYDRDVYDVCICRHFD